MNNYETAQYHAECQAWELISRNITCMQSKVINLEIELIITTPLTQWRRQIIASHALKYISFSQLLLDVTNSSEWRHMGVIASQITGNFIWWTTITIPKLCITGPIWGLPSRHRWIPSQCSSNAETVSMSYVIMLSCMISVIHYSRMPVGFLE